MDDKQKSAPEPFQRIFLSPPDLRGREREYVLEALDRNWIAPLGPFVTRFESSLQEFLKVPSIVALNSGTSAMHLALRLAGVKEGDEVICPTSSFIASAAPVTYLGAKPVFVGCNPLTWNMDLQTLETAIIARRNAGASVKAAVFAYSYGMPSDMDDFVSLCQKHELPLIEDAAEALGSTWNGQAAGTFGDFGIYSFNGNKMITGSTGGALYCKNPADTLRARKLASQAKEDAPHFEHHEIGYNYAMSNIVAAILCAQMEQLTEKIAQRQHTFARYLQILADSKPANIDICYQREIDNTQSNRWLSTFYSPSQEGSAYITLLRNNLSKANADHRPLWKPLHLQKAFAGCTYFGDGFSEKLFQNGICLPSGLTPTLLEERILPALVANF